VAVSAVDPDTGDMVLMAERHRLLAYNARFGQIRRPNDDANPNRHCRNDEYRAENADFGKRVRATVENLRHKTLRPPSITGTLGSPQGSLSFGL
jgi:hypothetical protein